MGLVPIVQGKNETKIYVIVYFRWNVHIREQREGRQKRKSILPDLLLCITCKCERCEFPRQGLEMCSVWASRETGLEIQGEVNVWLFQRRGKEGVGYRDLVRVCESGKWRQSHSQFLQLTPSSSSGKEVEMWYWCLWVRYSQFHPVCVNKTGFTLTAGWVNQFGDHL